MAHRELERYSNLQTNLALAYSPTNQLQDHRVPSDVFIKDQALYDRINPIGHVIRMAVMLFIKVSSVAITIFPMITISLLLFRCFWFRLYHLRMVAWYGLLLGKFVRKHFEFSFGGL